MPKKYILNNSENGITLEASTLRELADMSGLTISSLFRIKSGDVHTINNSKFSKYGMQVLKK